MNADPVANLLDLARRHAEAGRGAIARGILEGLIDTTPDDARPRHHLGALLAPTEPALAAVHLGAALALAPAEPGVLVDLGGLPRVPNPFLWLRRADALLPGQPPILELLGHRHWVEGRPGRAAQAQGRALVLIPVDPMNLNNLGMSLVDLGAGRAARRAFDRAARLAPGYTPALSNAAFGSCYDPDCGRAESLALHQRAARAHGEAEVAAAGLVHDPDPDRPLVLGFLPAEYGPAAMGRFLNPLLRHLPGARTRVIAYGPGCDDPAFDRIERVAIPPGGDRALIERVRADRVDVMIDLAGHVAGASPGVFAARVAPVQASWLGYFATTAIPAMDAMILDPHWAPPGAEAWFTEALVRLPRTRFCYEPWPGAPDVAPPPARARGQVTFGSFNKIAKLSDAVLGLWARILNGAPGARLMLKATTLGDALERQRIAGRFAAEGGDARRLILAGPSTPIETLAAYAEIDVALDPFPFGGGLTTCDALWMGVPVVSLVGDSPLSRQGLGLLAAAGLGALACATPDAYVGAALALAAAPEALAARRAGLRARVAASALGDAPAFARDFEAAIRGLWHRRLASL